MSGEGEKFDFTISPVSQIQSFEIVNPELLSGVRIINELADDDYAFSYILQDLRFKVSYTDLEGNIVTDTIGFYDDNDVIGSINISYDKGDYEDPSTQVGKKDLYFYPDGMETLKKSVEVEFCALEDEIANLPEVIADGTEVNVPVNYNLGKCFTFTAPEDGIYILDFGVTAGTFFVTTENVYSLQNKDGDSIRIDAAAGTEYVFCVLFVI